MNKTYDRKAFEPLPSLVCALLLLLVSVSVIGCSSQSSSTRGSKEKSSSFFGRLMDQITERECRVYGFTCPYGLGPADEPCECADPSGRVLYGKTIK